MRKIDVFIDFSDITVDFQFLEVIARLDSPEFLGDIARRITCAVPSWRLTQMELFGDSTWRFVATDALEACSHAMAAAADVDHPLLVLLSGDIEPGCEAVGTLLAAINADPMVGFVLPRMKGSQDNSLARLDHRGDEAIDELPRRVLCEIPSTYLIADTPSRCLLIKAMILANFGALDQRFQSLAGALWHYLAQARRCGFRTLVCNHAVVSSTYLERPCLPSAISYQELPEADRALLRELSADTVRAHEEFGAAVPAWAESRLARALPHAFDTRPSLLLDVRNLISGINGTAVAALGIAKGLYALGSEWEVGLLATQEACAFHKLEESFPGWRVYTRLPSRQFTVALRLSQPWRVQEMIDLHNMAAYTVYLFLDTISWDIVYASPPHLEGTWSFMADQADGLLFISEFTRERFHQRFPAGASIPSLVCHLSFESADYVHPELRLSTDPEGAMFVVGNEYDHKDVSRTIDILTRAFPYESIVALGSAAVSRPRVTILQSGNLSELEMHRLYAGSQIVVFPSFYEGFGLPILTTLAYGQTLFARRSSLLDEIAAHCRPHGRVVPFDRREELVELIGRVFHGQDVPELPLGTAIDKGRPKCWTDVGRSVMGFLTDLVSDLSRSGWRSRGHVIRQLTAARGVTG